MNQVETWTKIGDYPYYLSNWNRLKNRFHYEMENDVFLKWRESRGYYYFKGKFSLHKALCIIHHPTTNVNRPVKFIDRNRSNLDPANLMWKPEKVKRVKKIKRKHTFKKPVKLQFPVKGEQNVKAKLSYEIADRIRESAEKVPKIDTIILSKIYNVSETTILNIIRNKTWTVNK